MGKPIVRVKTNCLSVAFNRGIGFFRIALTRLQVVNQAVKEVQPWVTRIQLQRLVDGLASLRKFQVGGELQGRSSSLQRFRAGDLFQVWPQGIEYLQHGGCCTWRCLRCVHGRRYQRASCHDGQAGSHRPALGFKTRGFFCFDHGRVSCNARLAPGCSGTASDVTSLGCSCFILDRYGCLSSMVLYSALINLATR